MVSVLLVDTDPFVRQIVAEMLEEAELRVLAAAASATEAQALLDKNGMPAPAVLVVATRPLGSKSAGGLDGRAVATEIRQWPNYGGDRSVPLPLGVVYFGAHALALDCDALRPDEQFLTEPFGRGALARAVYGVIGREAPRWLASRARALPERRA